ncbi:MAG: hypothetical protein ACJ8DJ_21735 [Gemmatimonadales bacterium]
MSLPALPSKTVRKLGAVCGMLGSNYAGERAAAADAATKLLRGHGLTWRDVVDRAFAIAPTQPAPPAPPPWQQKAAVCECHPHRLSEWEREFVTTLRRWLREPSTKQRAVLSRLYLKATAP